LQKVLDKYEKNSYFAFATNTKPMNLLFKKNLERFYLKIERIYNDLQKKEHRSVFNRENSLIWFAIGYSNRIFVCSTK